MINAITVDVLRKKQNVIEKAIQETGPEDNSDSDEDVVLEEFGDESGAESDTTNEEADQNTDRDADPLPLIVTTHYGRNTGHWNLYQLQ